MSSFVDARRERAAKAWGLTNEIVLIEAGTPIGLPGGADQTFPYKPHPQYRWLTNRRRPGGVLAFAPQEGWELFEPPVTELELVWGPDELAVGRPISELEGWLTGKGSRPVAVLGSGTPTAGDAAELSNRLGIVLDHARRPKDAHEIDLLRRAASATAAGYRRLREVLRPGVTERALQIEFEAAVAMAGATGMGYASIVGSGPNTAVFHFTPGDRAVQEGELVLVDAGGEVDGYVCDVTRSYAGGGTFSDRQRWHYETVLKAEERAIAACTVGTEWLEVHRLAAHSMAGSMAEAGLLKCSADEAVEKGVMALFFPHGVGHLVGLGVRDAAGPLPGRDRIAEAAGVRVRIDMPLEAGFCVTVEPGLYFIPALLRDPARRERFTEQVNWEAVEPFIGNGGVRIEDDVLVTESGPSVLTAEIEK